MSENISVKSARRPAGYEALIERYGLDVIPNWRRSFVARTGVDEVIIASSMYDHDARKHSLALTMEAGKAL